MLSVVIPTRDKAYRLALTLSCLCAQDFKYPFEVIVVNDGSSDHTEDVLGQFLQGLNLHVLKGLCQGRASARNLGAAAAKYEYLIFLDDDVLVAPDFLATHYHVQQKKPGWVHGGLKEMIGLVNVVNPEEGGLGSPPIQKAELLTRGFNPSGYRLFTSALEKAVGIIFQERRYLNFSWLASSGANNSMPTVLWESMGGFDEVFGLNWGCEDLEFGYRLFLNKVPITLSKEATAYHMTHPRSQEWEEQSVNLEYLSKKHPGVDLNALSVLLKPTASVKEFFSMLDQDVVIVSGLPRSGTSMMMNILHAGGFPLIVDNFREADEDNLRGYFEFEKVKSLKEDTSWVSAAGGKVFKATSNFLKYLPENIRYKIIFMERDLDEVLDSQEKMLIRHNKRLFDKAELKLIYQKHLCAIKSWVKEQENMKVMYLDYSSVVRQPESELFKLASFLDVDFDHSIVLGVINPGLYRNRKETLVYQT